ncbi:lipopolysaccharide assembly protein LapB [Lactobacillus sp. Sy-1]|uniref:tetratricopeptide repeat protein n=1 Tax=Lactobacillus sp. Sy-1 TaxID=2109645 RepID=UPI001C596764|nr:tetratricopeptide repeat protein [Lactobacillus sp. Sy-1]MBW1605552.1 tetratricopeptide repeat protein [Lactobacillus sp. Sy-1]
MNSYSQRALDFLEAGKLTEFDEQFKLALKNDDDDLLFSFAEELYSLGFLPQAKQIYHQLLTKYPDADELRANLAEIAISEDQNDLALSYLSEIKPDSDSYVQSLMIAADLYQTQGLFEVSKQKLLAAKQAAPDEDVITFALAELYFSTREFDKAIPLYLHLIKKGITELSAVNLVERIGVAYANAGRFGHAIGYLKQIKLIDMTSDVKFETAFTYLQLGEYQQAVNVFEDLRDSDHDYPTLYPYLGEALEKLHKEKDALRVFQEGLGVDEYNEVLWQKAGDLALKLGETDQAEHYYRQGHQVAPDDLNLTIKLSNLLVQEEDYEGNVNFLKQYLETHAVDPQLAWNLATSYSEMESLDQATNYYQLAAKSFGDNPDFLKEAALFYRSVGKTDAMLPLLKRYIELEPTDGEMAQILSEYH